MRNPNGYGSVVKLSGNRRRPFIARKTKGWNEKGHPIYIEIGRFATREEAMIALAEYNKNPYDVDASKITMIELYEKWSERAFNKMGKASIEAHKMSFSKTISLHSMKYKDIKTYQMQEAVDLSGGYSTQGKVKNLFNHLDKFALEFDAITKCYSSLITTESTPETTKEPFTDEEVNKLWKIEEQAWVDSILVFLYSGFRISELLDLKTANVDLVEGTMKGGTKTKAGKNRIVPIHSKIFELIKLRFNENNEYLFSHKGKKLSHNTYYGFWNPIMKQLDLKHTVHETRHTFRSRLDSAGANKVCIDLLMGHSSGSVGERIYTHKTIQELKDAIELITS